MGVCGAPGELVLLPFEAAPEEVSAAAEAFEAAPAAGEQLRGLWALLAAEGGAAAALPEALEAAAGVLEGRGVLRAAAKKEEKAAHQAAVAALREEVARQADGDALAVARAALRWHGIAGAAAGVAPVPLAALRGGRGGDFARFLAAAARGRCGANGKERHRKGLEALEAYLAGDGGAERDVRGVVEAVLGAT